MMMSRNVIEAEILQAIVDGNRVFAEIMDAMTKSGYQLANSTLANYLSGLKLKRKIQGNEFNKNGKRIRQWTATNSAPEEVPDLLEPLLNMMGYTRQVPAGGRFINNENLPITYHVSKVNVYPGTSYGDVALRMP